VSARSEEVDREGRRADALLKPALAVGDAIDVALLAHLPAVLREGYPDDSIRKEALRRDVLLVWVTHLHLFDVRIDA
jgi:hypothetical protein